MRSNTSGSILYDIVDDHLCINQLGYVRQFVIGYTAIYKDGWMTI